MSTSWYSPTGSMFSRNVPSNRSGFWGTMDIAERTIVARSRGAGIKNLRRRTVMQAEFGDIYFVDEDSSRCGLNDSEEGEKKLQPKVVTIQTNKHQMSYR